MSFNLSPEVVGGLMFDEKMHLLKKLKRKEQERKMDAELSGDASGGTDPRLEPALRQEDMKRRSDVSRLRDYMKSGVGTSQRFSDFVAQSPPPRMPERNGAPVSVTSGFPGSMPSDASSDPQSLEFVRRLKEKEASDGARLREGLQKLSTMPKPPGIAGLDAPPTVTSLAAQNRQATGFQAGGAASGTVPEAPTPGYQLPAGSAMSKPFDLGRSLDAHLSRITGPMFNVEPERALTSLVTEFENAGDVDLEGLRSNVDGAKKRLDKLLAQRSEIAFDAPQRGKIDKGIVVTAIVFGLLQAFTDTRPANQRGPSFTTQILASADARVQRDYEDAIFNEQARVKALLDRSGAEVDQATLDYSHGLKMLSEGLQQSRFESEQGRLRDKEASDDVGKLYDDWNQPDLPQSAVASLAQRINALAPGMITAEMVKERTAEALEEGQSVRDARGALGYQRTGAGDLSRARADDLIATQPARVNELIASADLKGAQADLARINAAFVPFEFYVDFEKAMADIEQGWRALEIADKRADGAGVTKAKSGISAGVSKLNDILKAQVAAKRREIDSWRIAERSRNVAAAVKAGIPALITELEREVAELERQMKSNLQKSGVEGMEGLGGG